MSAVFLDTVGRLALWDRSDQWHSAAQAAFHRLTPARVAGITTTFVLAECANASARRPYRLAVDRLRQRLEARQVFRYHVASLPSLWHGGSNTGKPLWKSTS